MLTDEQIEDILYKYTNRQSEFNLSVLKVIADRLSKLADFDKLSMLDRTATMQEDVAQMERLHKKYIEEQVAAIDDDFWWIIFVIYTEAAGYYEHQTALQANTELYNAVQELIRKAKSSLKALLKNPVFVIRDLKNPAILKVHTFEKTYRSVMNEALSYSNVSKELQDVALKRTETQLFDAGISYMTDNSLNNAKDAKNANLAIRFNVLDSIKDLINNAQKIMGKQFGADAVELSAHVYPAPDHAPAQGHQFAIEEVEKIQSGADFEDLQGNKYVGFVRNIGEWNCRHYFMQIKKGAKPQYSQEQLDKILRENEIGYTDGHGKHRTLYECTQVQRRYEREIKRAKEKYLYGKTLNDRSMMANASNRVNKLTAQYKQFSRKCHIPIKPERISVKDYT